MNVAIKGPSSGGKSEIRRQVLEFFLPEAIVSFTTLSERALLYYEEDFAHKILSMGEAAGAEEQSLQDYLLRELISEGRLRYPVAQMKKGGLITTTIEKNGPVAFMVTTTKSALHPENETRMLSLEVDDSDIQTMSVLHKVAEIVGLNAERAAIDFNDFVSSAVAGHRELQCRHSICRKAGAAISTAIGAAEARLHTNPPQSKPMPSSTVNAPSMTAAT